MVGDGMVIQRPGRKEMVCVALTGGDVAGRVQNHQIATAQQGKNRQQGEGRSKGTKALQDRSC